ncbi:uncharacterized protein LOC143272265 [Peromyscus maniculatus bairdii]|uniref:uncharacterized protein LOC143272265 n=1 Tax=Peromyscus maniculatus bairdii TaxID=230844 RepID=UPI003FCFBF67
MLGVGGARSRVRDLRCGDTGADAAAAHPAPSNFRSPVRQRLGPGTKRPRQPMAAGQRREATNQRAPHAPSRPEHGASKSPEHCQRIFSDLLNANGDCYIVL